MEGNPETRDVLRLAPNKTDASSDAWRMMGQGEKFIVGFHNIIRKLDRPSHLRTFCRKLVKFHDDKHDVEKDMMASSCEIFKAVAMETLGPRHGHVNHDAYSICNECKAWGKFFENSALMFSK